MRTVTKETREVTETVITVTCDVCGYKVKGHSNALTTCEMCKRDLCRKCIKFDPHEDTGDCDYTYFCEKCWQIGEPYRERDKELENEAATQFDLWRRACKQKAD